MIGLLAGAIVGGIVAVELETSDCPRNRRCEASAGVTIAGVAVGAALGVLVGGLAGWIFDGVRRM
ncbi:MAG TPA: hypothetical protein VEA99_00975 [Gemmatimonadaceae bacterium]|nr:hypothetical protein [Gemmatimonadaceae bacterium]